MYIWVILATFVVALFSYNLSVRSDSRDLYVTPQAQAVVSKLLIQHEAVTKYTKKQYKLAKKGQGEKMFMGKVDLSKKENPETGESTSEVLSETVLQGFKPEVGEVSKLYCIKSRDMHDTTVFKQLELTADIKLCQGSEGTTQINEDGSTKVDENGNPIPNKNYARLYVVTTMPIPVRWRARGANGSTMEAPSEDLIKAIKKTSTQGVKMGYVVPVSKYTNTDQKIDKEGNLYKDSAGNSLTVGDFDYFISGFQDKLVPIPNAISQNGLFAADSNCQKNSSNCLIVMSVVR